jgi:hypothetical protein
MNPQRSPNAALCFAAKSSHVGIKPCFNGYRAPRRPADALVRLATLIESIVSPHTSNVVALRR